VRGDVGGSNRCIASRCILYCLPSSRMLVSTTSYHLRRAGEMGRGGGAGADLGSCLLFRDGRQAGQVQ
jgi:hypothetical protein